MRANINHPLHGICVDIFYFSLFSGNESYIDPNKKLNELYMSNEIGYGNNSDSIVGKSFQNILPEPCGKVSTGYLYVNVTAQV